MKKIFLLPLFIMATACTKGDPKLNAAFTETKDSLVQLGLKVTKEELDKDLGKAGKASFVSFADSSLSLKTDAFMLTKSPGNDYEKKGVSLTVMMHVPNGNPKVVGESIDRAHAYITPALVRNPDTLKKFQNFYFESTTKPKLFPANGEPKMSELKEGNYEIVVNPVATQPGRIMLSLIVKNKDF